MNPHGIFGTPYHKGNKMIPDLSQMMRQAQKEKEREAWVSFMIAAYQKIDSMPIAGKEADLMMEEYKERYPDD